MERPIACNLTSADAFNSQFNFEFNYEFNFQFKRLPAAHRVWKKPASMYPALQKTICTSMPLVASMTSAR